MFAYCTLHVLSQFCSMAFEKGCGGEKKIQPPEVFCKERCSKIFRKIHRKKPVPESYLNKFAGFIKK